MFNVLQGECANEKFIIEQSQMVPKSVPESMKWQSKIYMLENVMPTYIEHVPKCCAVVQMGAPKGVSKHWKNLRNVKNINW